jgi:hypothetical protein
VVEGSSEAPSLLVALSSTADLIEGRMDATATNEVLWGGSADVNRHLIIVPQTRARVGVAGFLVQN